MDFDNTRLDYRKRKGSVTNGQAMALSTEWCRSSLASYLDNRAGGHGGAVTGSEQDLHDVMCDYCRLSDELRGVAMHASQCDCLDFLPQEFRPSPMQRPRSMQQRGMPASRLRMCSKGI
eukprot:CAMPEP_0178520802 /NCGR_PEP_ID=MMETSP0696-20121128/27605_1 /TAXON_ID=265572 /ORGANISM="Extubocellulus spinifer, Strain CCMP396" /LENGTH=118 /DNA_ID=CAMNT_0020151697 /DNA_START=380 /DNA_END=736 /DNA_ORIENTATION=-